MANVDLFALIAKELSCGKIDSALWTRALAECNGDADRTKAHYIKLRHAALAERLAASPAPAPAIVNAETLQLRRDLRKELAAQGKKSLYAVLGCAPDVSDATIRVRCQEIRDQHAQAGTDIPSETRYALDTLGTPTARASYDQKLMDQLGYSVAPAPTRGASAIDNSDGGFMDWWATRKVSVIIGVVALLAFGYLIRGYMVSKGNQDVAHRVVDTAREVVANDAGRVENERILAEGHVNNQARAIEVVSDLGNRTIGVAERAEDRQRIEAQARANVLNADADARRASIDDRRAQAEQDREQAKQSREAAAEERNREATRVQAMNQSITERDFYTARQLAKSDSEHSRIDSAERAANAQQERIDAQDARATNSGRNTSNNYRY